MRLTHLPLLAVICLCGTTGGVADDAAKPAGEPKTRTAEELAAIQTIRDAGGQVLEIAQNNPRLDISYHLADGDITDAALEPLRKLSDVEQINLRATKVTDAGLTSLAHLKTLTRLHLENTEISDAGLVHLKGLENLEYLNLYGTKVTDAGLSELEGLKNLRRLYLWQTAVTDAGAEKLGAALPELTINRGLDLTPEPKEAPAEEKKE